MHSPVITRRLDCHGSKLPLGHPAGLADLAKALKSLLHLDKYLILILGRQSIPDPLHPLPFGLL